MKSQRKNVSHTTAGWALLGLLIAMVGSLRGWPNIVAGTLAAVCFVVLMVYAIRWMVAHSGRCANCQVGTNHQAEEENKH